MPTPPRSRSAATTIVPVSTPLTKAERATCWTTLFRRAPCYMRVDSDGHADDDDGFEIADVAGYARQSEDPTDDVTPETVERFLVLERDESVLALSTMRSDVLPDAISRLLSDPDWSIEGVFDLLTDQPVKYTTQVSVRFADGTQGTAQIKG